MFVSCGERQVWFLALGKMQCTFIPKTDFTFGEI